MKSLLKAAAAILALGIAGLPATAEERPGTILVLDASGSMWGQIDGVNKIVIAREVVADILSDFPQDQNLGFVTYGHRERGQCSDIQTVIEPAPGTAQDIIRIVNTLDPRGMTPMTDAVIVAAEALRHTEQAATVILVSDGIETCNPDPCAAARALAQSGIDFTAHVIGFDVSEEAEALMQMQCIAAETGGRFLTADNAQELSDALQQVVAAPAKANDTPEQEQEPEPALPEATVSAPAQVVVGSAFAVTWQAEGLHPRDYVTIVPAGADESAYTDYDRTEGGSEGSLRAPAEPGLYEVRLKLDAGGRVLATTPIEVVDIEVSVSAPAQVVVGSSFAVTWQADGLHPRDYVTIVPAGADESAYTDYDRIEDGNEGSLRAPAEPGLYEVRLKLDAGGRVLATTQVEVVDVKVSVSAPAQVVVGSAFAVTWQADGLHPRDYVTIVPAGADEGAYTDYDRIEDGHEGSLRAPAEPGLYEVRLNLDAGGRVLATTPIEVVEGDVTVNGPDRVRAGTEMTLAWTGTIHPRDYLTIVPAGAEDGTYAAYIRVNEATQGKLAAPAETGLYELRYMLDHGGRVMARHTIEVVAADAPMDDGAGLVAPATAAPGETITVTWTGGADSPDQRVTLARADQPDFSWISAESAIDRNSLEITLPDAPGSYEVRFLDVAGRTVLGRSIVAVGP